MDHFDLSASSHASCRKQQRAISDSQLDLVLDWGRTWRQGAGRTVHFVGTRDVRRASRIGVDLHHARNIAIVVADDGTVITVIKSDDLRRLRLAGGRQRRICSRNGGIG